jgi:acetyl esterase/lipase
MLVILRDRDIPLPAGAVLISPWVDLTHSFPSVSGDNPLDYIPPHGFHQRPSASWPPPNSDDMLAIEESLVKKLAKMDHASFPQQSEADAIQGFHVDHHPDIGTRNDTAATGTVTNNGSGLAANTVPGPGHNLSIMIDGNLVEIKDQIQMYASNQLISHPLVSPILQPSLGGLPPLLILTGGGEMLRDEQIYIAHKAANPPKYPPGEAFLNENPYDHNRDQVNRWKPTDVQLQVWEDLCHVAPTLSFTRPAKYMYRSIAQFGAWSLARAQNTEIDILDDDDVSVISQSESDNEDGVNHDGATKSKLNNETSRTLPLGQVGKAGDPLPPFKNHMIRQKIDRHGNVFPLEPISELVGCNLDPSEIGVIKEGPVKKWMAAKREWDTKFASAKRNVQKKRAKEMAAGYQSFGDGEVPPPSALAGRRKTGEDLREQKNKKSMGLSMWSLWGSKHDKMTIDREKEVDTEPATSTAIAADGEGARPWDHSNKTKQGEETDRSKKPRVTSRSRSHRSFVSDQNQADGMDENTPVADLLALKSAQNSKAPTDSMDPLENTVASNENNPLILVRSPTIKETSSRMDEDGNQFDLKRPKAGGIAFPFTVRGHSQSASMNTLTSSHGVTPMDDYRVTGATQSGVTPMDGKGEKVIENGEVVSAHRPELDTFVTATEGYFPTVTKTNAISA